MITPTLFIGVGGLGDNLVRRVRRRLLMLHEEEGGFDPSLFHFVVMDPQVNMPAGATVDPKDGFERSHYYQMQGFNQRVYDADMGMPGFADIRRRAYPGYLVRPSATNGYNQVRWNGAFGLKLNTSAVRGNINLVQFLRDALGHLMSHTTAIHRGGAGVVIYVCASLCGGTGSGVALDLGYLIQALAMQAGYDPHVYGVFGLPELMAKFAHAYKESFYANAYAFLKELNWYMLPADPAANAQTRRFYYRASFGSVVVDEERAENPISNPYDHVFLLSTYGQEGGVINDAGSVLDMAAEALCLMNAKGAEQYQPNVERNRPYVENRLQQRRATSFGGLGSCTLRFPVVQVRNYLLALCLPPILTDYLISPKAAGSLGGRRAEDFRCSDQIPFRLDKMEALAAGRMPGTNLNYTDRINSTQMPEAGTIEDDGALSELDALVGFFQEVKRDAEDEVARRRLPVLQQELDRHCSAVRARVDTVYAEVFEGKGNLVALGEAAVFLGDLKKYCKGLTGYGLTGEEASSPDLLKARAAALRARVERTYLTRDSAELQKLAFEHEGWTGRQKNYRLRIGTAVATIIELTAQAAILDELHSFYLKVLQHVEARKRPIRFIQEEVAGAYYGALKGNPATRLYVASNEAHGLEDLRCATEEAVQLVVVPFVPLLSRDAKARQELETRLFGVALPQIRQLVEDLGGELKNVPEEQRERYLHDHKKQYERALEKILVEVYGGELESVLKRDFSIGQVLVREAMARGETKAKAAVHARSVVSRMAQQAQVYSGMDYNARGSAAAEMERVLLLDRDAFNQAIAAHSGGNYDIATDTLIGMGEPLTTQDPFSISMLCVGKNWPLYTLKMLAQCRSSYNQYVPYTKGSKPVHTDYRFENPNAAPEFQLPTVEMVQDENDADIFLFLLAEQDWWKGLEGFQEVDGGSEWDGSLGPLVTQAKNYYTWRGPNGEQSELGRERAQTAFCIDEKSLREGIREVLQRRWNTAFTKQEQKKLLTSLRDKKAKDKTTTQYKELIRCYANEQRILDERLEEGNYAL